MGNYFYFWTAPPSGMAEQFKHAPLKEWLAYAQKTLAEFPEDYEPALLELAAKLIANPEPIHLESENYADFDKLIHVVYLDTANEFISNTWLPSQATQGTLAYRWYLNEFEKIEHQCLPQLANLLRWPVIGRPICRDADSFPYVQADYSCLTAYWSAEEVLQIQKEWPFSAEADSSLYALREALTIAAAEGKGLTMLCT